MAAKNAVLLVTRELETEKAVSKALEASDRLEVAGPCARLDDLAGRLERDVAPVALVDIDPQPGEILRRLEEMTSRFSSTRFVVLSRELRSDLVLEAMQAGARHFLVKQDIGSTLSGVLHRLVPNGVNSPEASSLVTVLSVSGGCGATTIAVNLANEIQLEAKGSVLVVDLDAAYGAVGPYLDVKGQYGIADVLSSHERIDADLIRSTAISYSDDLRVLVSPATGSPGLTALDYTLLDRTLAACKAAATATVVDAPRVPIEVAATLARASRLVLVVFQLAVKDVRSVKMFVDALVERDVDGRRVLAVGNRYHKRRSLVSLDEARKALKDVAVETLANDFESAARALNYGQPLSRAAPRSLLRRDLQRLAARISSPTHTNGVFAKIAAV